TSLGNGISLERMRFIVPFLPHSTPPNSNLPPTNNTSVSVPVAGLVGVALVIVILLFILLILLARRGSSEHTSQAARPAATVASVAPVSHFVPDEIALVVEHAAGMPSAQVLQGVAQDSRVASAGGLGRAIARSGRVTMLSRGQGGVVSLVVATMPGTDQTTL